MDGQGTDWTPGVVPGQEPIPGRSVPGVSWSPAPTAQDSGALVPAGTGQTPQGDQILLWIDDIGVSRHWVVTPNGTGPLAESQWIVRDGSRTEEKMPAYAIV